jgi:mRNA-degrading endonuclease RelE of RelBE toxin-antitoxin system
MKRITWHNRARKQMKRIPRHYQDAIFQSVDKLVTFPDCKNLDVKALQKHKYEYRMRVGRYRVFFDDRKEIEVIAIQEVKKRDDHTY